MSKRKLKINFKMVGSYQVFMMFFHIFAYQIMAKRLLHIFILSCLSITCMAQNDSIVINDNSTFEEVPLPTYVLKDPRQGLHFEVDMAVMAQFGSHAHNCVGFGQRLSALYEVPLSDRISLSVGGYLQNITWGKDSHHDAGVEARLNYMFNEKLFGEVYVMKNISTHYDIERIGASLEYHFSPSFSMGISVEGTRVNGKGNTYRNPYHLYYW